MSSVASEIESGTESVKGRETDQLTKSWKGTAATANLAKTAAEICETEDLEIPMITIGNMHDHLDTYDTFL